MQPLQRTNRISQMHEQAAHEHNVELSELRRADVVDAEVDSSGF
jgi:hypothetical protein